MCSKLFVITISCQSLCIGNNTLQLPNIILCIIFGEKIILSIICICILTNMEMGAWKRRLLSSRNYSEHAKKTAVSNLFIVGHMFYKAPVEVFLIAVAPLLDCGYESAVDEEYLCSFLTSKKARDFFLYTNHS